MNAHSPQHVIYSSLYPWSFGNGTGPVVTSPRFSSHTWAASPYLFCTGVRLRPEGPERLGLTEIQCFPNSSSHCHQSADKCPQNHAIGWASVVVSGWFRLLYRSFPSRVWLKHSKPLYQVQLTIRCVHVCSALNGSVNWTLPGNTIQAAEPTATATLFPTITQSVLSVSQTATKRIKTRSNTKSCYLLSGRNNWQAREGRVLPPRHS